MDELTIGDKIYISSKRAAEITGYAKDYIGQLCREGRVEATLVGRSWYVLETSIRAHRFGSDMDDAQPQKTAEEPVEAFRTWERANYVAEPVYDLPVVERKSINLLDQEVARAETETKTQSIEDMQAAWKEWFASREATKVENLQVEEESINEPLVEVIEEETDNTVEFEAVATVIDPVPSTPEVEEPVLIHRTQPNSASYIAPVASTRAEGRRPAKRVLRSKASTSYLAVQTLFIAVALLAVAVAVVGSGYADPFLNKDGLEYAPLRFLGGTSLLDK